MAYFVTEKATGNNRTGRTWR